MTRGHPIIPRPEIYIIEYVTGVLGSYHKKETKIPTPFCYIFPNLSVIDRRKVLSLNKGIDRLRKCN